MSKYIDVDKLKYICDAQIMKDAGFNYLKFIINNDEYSRMLQNLPAGHFVEVYMKLK
jgi:hypothetical protein